MKSPRHRISRIALGGVATAVAATALVGAATTSAQAAPVSTTYTCTAAGTSGSFPTTVDAALPPTAPAGFPVPAGFLTYNSTITVPSTLAPLLTSAGTTGGKSTDFAIAFGPKSVTAPVAWTTGTTNSDGSVTYSGKGANAAFTTPGAGSYSITMPKSFTLTATNASGGTVITAACTSASPSLLGSTTLSKQATTIKAKVKPAKVKAGKPAKVQVKISNQFSKQGGEAVTGKVTVKDGKKKAGSATIKNGKATVKLKGLKAGTHKLTVSYKGDQFSGKAKAKLTVKVTK